MSALTLPDPGPVWGRIRGTVAASDGATVEVRGLGGLARLGDQMLIEAEAGLLPGEVVAVGARVVTVLLMGRPAGLAAGQRAWLQGAPDPRPDESWLGHVVDAYGRDREGRPLPQGPPPEPAPLGNRRGLGRRLATGLAALDTLLPLCRGQRIGVFAGSGVGKSRLVTDLARGVAAEVAVIGLIGERTREVGDFIRELEVRGAMERSVVITATADQPALVKRRAAELTLATSEYFRARGRQVLCLLDSLTRFAEAHREIALAAGEPPALRAFPPSTMQAISALCERAGPGWQGQSGDTTAIFTVLVAGSDMDEPVADMVRGVLDGHIVLDREIAERGRFPAIDVRRSVSRSAPAAWSPDEEKLAVRARRLIAAYEEAAPMIQAGLYAPGTDALLDEAVARWPDLDAFVGAVPGRQADTDSFADLAALLGADPPSEPAGE